MTDHPIEFSGLIASRICHDLISPIGAIANGLELLTLSGDAPQTPEMTLIEDSVQNAKARLEVFRVAFGKMDSLSSMSASLGSRLLKGWFSGGRITAYWHSDDNVPRDLAQRALLGAMCAETALLRGGEIVCHLQEDRVEIIAQGTEIKTETGEWGHLVGAGLPALPAARIQFALLRALTRAPGGVLVEASEEALTITC